MGLQQGRFTNTSYSGSPFTGGGGFRRSLPDGNYVLSGFGTLGMNPGTPLLTTELNLTLAVM